MHVHCKHESMIYFVGVGYNSVSRKYCLSWDIRVHVGTFLMLQVENNKK